MARRRRDRDDRPGHRKLSRQLRERGLYRVTVEVISLGCRLNLSESESLRAMLDAESNLVVVNSCAVTGAALRETRAAIRKARRARPDARLLVTGCAAETDRAALARMAEVDGFVANGAKLDPRAWNVSASAAAPRPALHTRAFVAVQTGCDHACTFCVIPEGRGGSRSRSADDVCGEIARAVDAGVREVVLTAVDLTAWGQDLDGAPPLGALVRAILDECPALPRLRLSSLDPGEIDGELFELLAGEARVMPQVHLSLQHGDDLILKRMKRRHSRADAAALVAGLRARRPDIAVGADLIAGFPTEDDAAHAANLSAVRELGIVHGHVFPFSARGRTPAARMPQVERTVIKARAAELRGAVAAERARWLASLVAVPQKVLAERDGTGHSENFARVRLPEGIAAGDVVTVVPNGVDVGLLA
ncbi:MAG: MiaB/RimO family radical SAM methylthiotransferase [Sphingomonadales bacterium]|nr:MiaB/RimO family radical SAM methylthiotransferase [Sphingomonadales bacterium]